MPRLPIDYSRTVIYRISCNDLSDFIYVGSTTDFTNRKRKHKSASKIEDTKLYLTIRENGNWENWRMTIIEEYPECKNCIEQKIREQKWIDELNANLNMVKSYSSQEEKTQNMKEYYEQNKEEIIPQQKEYYQQHKEQFAQKRKEYYEQNKERILQKRKEDYEQKKQKK